MLRRVEEVETEWIQSEIKREDVLLMSLRIVRNKIRWSVKRFLQLVEDLHPRCQENTLPQNDVRSLHNVSPKRSPSRPCFGLTFTFDTYVLGHTAKGRVGRQLTVGGFVS